MRTNFTVLKDVLHSNYRSRNLIGSYDFWGIRTEKCGGAKEEARA